MLSSVIGSQQLFASSNAECCVTSYDHPDVPTHRIAPGAPVQEVTTMGFLAILGQFVGGLGLLLMGLAALWFVSEYAKKR
jgi:hypothetical protein